jgi:hypothetical protein
MMSLGQNDTSGILGSEKTRMRALSLNIIRSIVELHNGCVERNLITDSIDIDLPHDEAAACAKEIGEQMGLVCQHMYSQVDALFRGEVLICFCSN